MSSEVAGIHREIADIERQLRRRDITDAERRQLERSLSQLESALDDEAFYNDLSFDLDTL